MSTKIIWENSVQEKSLTFGDLKVGESFSIDSIASKGAVYRKVDLTEFLHALPLGRGTVRAYTPSTVQENHAMEEVATGKVFHPTTSKVKRVEIEIKISARKPNISGYV